MRARGRRLVGALVRWAWLAAFLASPGAVDAASLVGTTTTPTAFVSAGRFYVQYANGHYWVAFHNGTTPVLFSSPDAATWTSQGAIFSSFNPTSGLGEWAVRYQGTTVVAVAFQAVPTGRRYRNGVLNGDGTVTWNGADSAAGPGITSWEPLNAVIVNNRPVFWRADSGGEGRFRWGSQLSGPVWTDTTGDAPGLSTATDGFFFGGGVFPTGGSDPEDLIVVRATTNNSYVAGRHRLVSVKYDASLDPDPYEASWYDVSTLNGGLTEDTSTHVKEGANPDRHRRFAAVRDSTGALHAVYVNRQDNVVHYRKDVGFNDNWARVSVDVTQSASVIDRVALTAIAAENLLLFYSKSDGGIYSRRYDGSAWGAETTVEAASATPLQGALATIELAGSCSTGVAWTEGAGSPYDVMFSLQFTGCARLQATEGAGTITVTGPGAFEMVFEAASGGGIHEFHDLDLDPTRAYDLAGSPVSGPFIGENLVHHSFFDGTDWFIANASTPHLDLLEATPARVKVRRFGRFTNNTDLFSAAYLWQDYTIHPAGRVGARTAIAFTRAPIDFTQHTHGLAVHRTASGPLSSWTAYYDNGAAPDLSSGASDFLLFRSNDAAVTTDFLQILSEDWLSPPHEEDADEVNFTTWGAPDDWALLDWRHDSDPTPTNFPSGVTDVWHSLLYFKPTDLGDTANPWLDTEVTRRASDYRGPDTLVVVGGRGSRWADDREYAPVADATDFFNEAEGAYVVNIDPSLGLEVDIDGSPTDPRYAPLFKIREWRSTSSHPTVKLEGVTLSANSDYVAAVKPVARAPFADDLLWHSSFQNMTTAVTSPDVGGPGTANGGVGTAWFRYGQAGAFTALGRTVSFGGPGDPDNHQVAQGAIDFWHSPSTSYTSASVRRLYTYFEDASNQHRLTKQADSSLEFELLAGGVSTSVVIASTDYGWELGDLVHIRVTWDASAPLGDQARVFVNGVEPVHTDPTNAYDPSGMGDDGTVWVGGDEAGALMAFGLIDEFTVYSSPVAPGPVGATPDPRGHSGLARGGLVSSPDERLGVAGQDFTLSFGTVDAAGRGEYLYFGADSRFRGLNVTLETAGAGNSPDLQWEYWSWTNAGWEDLEDGCPAACTYGFTDETNSFTQNGSIYWTTDLPSWTPYSVNGGTDLFWVRAHLASGDYGVQAPVESQITTDILLLQLCGDITAPAQTLDILAPVPTAVELISFEARPLDAAVELDWQTGSELDNLGFHLYRSLSASGPWTPITPSLIPGLGSSPEGASYSWVDAGLLNGLRYYYRLEDVDLTSTSTFHGPVSAVPAAPVDGDPEDEESSSSSSAPPVPSPGPAPAPGPAPPGPPAPSPGEGEAPVEPEPACDEDGTCLYGDPGEPALRVLSRTAQEMTVELETPGFMASFDHAGVRVSVPGFAFPIRTGAVDLPLKRAVLEALVGKQARLVSIEAEDEVSWTDLRPAALGAPDVDARPDGTVRPVRLRVPLGPSPLSAPRARIAGSAFMGQNKKLALEIHPLRWDSAGGRLVLTKTLRVRIAFVGGVPEESGSGSLGRRNPRQHRTAAPVYAHFHTTERGLHAVPYEAVFLRSGRGVPVSALRLVQNGRVVPLHVEPPSPVFGPGSTLYFHADRTARSTDFTSELSFALERAAGGVVMARGSAAPLAGPVGTASRGTARFETDKIYQAGLLLAPDIWLWQYAANGTSRSLTLSLESVDTASALPARVRVYLQGGSDASKPGEHHVSFSLNGVSLGDGSFEGKVAYEFAGTLPTSALVEGDNTFVFTNVGDTGVSSRVFLDRVEIDYPQAPALRDGRFSGEWGSEGVAQVSLGAVPDPSRVSALDVTDPAAPVWLSGLEPGPASVRLQVEAGHRYQVVAPEGVLVPRVSIPRNTDLRDTRHQADYVLVAPEAFMGAAEPLLLRRESQGLSTFAASIEDIGAEFGGGSPSGQAIREFLAFAYHSWQDPAPRYVVLLGDSSTDPRDNMGLGWRAPLPALWMKTSYLWTASDPALAAVNGGDLLPDLAVGRLPAADLEEAHALVQKVLDWEDAGYDLSGDVALVADNPDDAGDFEADIEDIASTFLASRSPRRIRLRDLGAGTRTAILGAMDSGLAILSYAGHGAPALWASENVLDFSDPTRLLEQPRQPLMLTMTCLNGYFVSPNVDSLAEAFLKAEGRGTIAAFSPSGLSLDEPAHVFHKKVMNQIVNGGHARLGDALLAAQQDYALEGLMPELLAVYTLFGDPALVVSGR